ncbi:MAG: choice-of-anchor J domain-containing protein, partial [Ignavibacteria bacterium]|nr:choice-of-anchor J domain-containing protein [Ignavibacteria bacterium]
MRKCFYSIVFILVLNGIVIGQNLNESFSGEMFPPQGWTAHNFGDPQNNWARSTVNTNYRTPPAGARVFINVNTPPFNEWLITPRLDLTATAFIDTLTCWVKTEGTFAAGEKLSIRLSTTNTDTASFTNTLSTINTVTSGWLEVKIPLNSFESESRVYIAFQANLSWPTYRAAVDDISGLPLYTENIDVGTVGLTVSSLPIRIGQLNTITATFKNFGTSTVTNFYGYFQVTESENYLDSVLIDNLNPQQEINK